MLVVGDMVSAQLSPGKGAPTGLYQYRCLEVRVLEPPAALAIESAALSGRTRDAQSHLGLRNWISLSLEIFHPVPEYHARSGRRDAFDSRALEGCAVAAACSEARTLI